MATIKYLSDDRAQVQYYDQNGVRRRPVLPKKQAELLYKTLQAEEGAKGIFESLGIDTQNILKANNSKKLLFKDIAEKYLNEHLLKHTRAKSNQYYVKVLIKKWGSYRIGLLNMSSFREWIWTALDSEIWTPKNDSWKLTQLDTSSVEKLIRYMTAIFNFAIENQILLNHSFSKIKDRALKKEFRRRKKNFKPVTITTEELHSMVETFPEYVKYPAMCLFYSGIRRGELSKIRWDNIDRKKHCFEFYADETKETDSKKVFYDSDLEPILEKLELEYITSGYSDNVVFRNGNGGAVSESSLNHSMRYYCDKYAVKTGEDKFKKVTPHSFRRSYKTRKDLEGADPKAVSRNMGHHSLQTSEIYNIVDEQRQSLIAGYNTPTSSDIEKQIEKTIQSGIEQGFSLVDLQASIRKIYLNLKKNQVS